MAAHHGLLMHDDGTPGADHQREHDAAASAATPGEEQAAPSVKVFSGLDSGREQTCPDR